MLPIGAALAAGTAWANLEINVLDDCSPTPDTLRVAEGFAATDPRSQVVRMAENGGAYVARDHGLDMATGEFATLHDVDDWSHPALLHKSPDGRAAPFPGQTYPTASVTGMPSAVKPLRTATRMWNSAT